VIQTSVEDGFLGWRTWRRVRAQGSIESAHMEVAVETTAV
jgi:hypothetical protein